MDSKVSFVWTMGEAWPGDDAVGSWIPDKQVWRGVLRCQMDCSLLTVAIPHHILLKKGLPWHIATDNTLQAKRHKEYEFYFKRSHLHHLLPWCSPFSVHFSGYNQSHTNSSTLSLSSSPSGFFWSLCSPFTCPWLVLLLFRSFQMECSEFHPPCFKLFPGGLK